MLEMTNHKEEGPDRGGTGGRGPDRGGTGGRGPDRGGIGGKGPTAVGPPIQWEATVE